MNWKAVAKILGKILIAEAVMLLLPLVVAAYYGEHTYSSFLIPFFALLALGVPTLFIKAEGEDKKIYAKEGFAIVAFAWLALAAIGAIPFVLSKAIPNYASALFETISGFTTTGASVLSDVESLPKSILFWRSFTNWIGGMGVLVFVLAILPKENSGIIHAFRAEATGPNVGKLTSKMGRTARILYAIYIFFTLLEMLFLLCGNMPIFDAVTTSLANAGTGGFSVKNASIASYNSLYIEMVVTVFMFIFSVNFNLYFLILTGHAAKALKSEEALAFTAMVIISIFAVAANIYYSVDSIRTFGSAMRYSSFQVLSLSSTTGFSSIDYNSWPTFSKGIFLFLMVTGGMAGSTAGGIKMSRLMILGKSTHADLKKMVHPRQIITVKMEGETVQQNTIDNVRVFFVIWVAILISCTLLISIEKTGDFFTNFSASLSCVSNIGPGFDGVGPAANFNAYTSFSKCVLSLEMLFGRLEIFPLILLFSPSTYRK